MTTNILDQLFLITDIKSYNSQQNFSQYGNTAREHGGICYKIWFVGVQDKKEYHTFVDATYKNYNNWKNIIENPELGYFVRDLKLTKDREYLISADSPVKIDIHTKLKDTAIDLLEKYWTAS